MSSSSSFCPSSQTMPYFMNAFPLKVIPRSTDLVYHLGTILMNMGSWIFSCIVRAKCSILISEYKKPIGQVAIILFLIKNILIFSHSLLLCTNIRNTIVGKNWSFYTLLLEAPQLPQLSILLRIRRTSVNSFAENFLFDTFRWGPRRGATIPCERIRWLVFWTLSLTADTDTCILYHWLLPIPSDGLFQFCSHQHNLHYQ